MSVLEMTTYEARVELAGYLAEILTDYRDDKDWSPRRMQAVEMAIEALKEKELNDMAGVWTKEMLTLLHSNPIHTIDPRMVDKINEIGLPNPMTSDDLRRLLGKED